jgi:hypothetical protein
MKTALFWAITQRVVLKMRNSPEERSSHLLCGGSLKSPIEYEMSGCRWKGNNKTDMTETSRARGCELDSAVKQRILANTVMNIRIQNNGSIFFNV